MGKRTGHEAHSTRSDPQVEIPTTKVPVPKSGGSRRGESAPVFKESGVAVADERYEPMTDDRAMERDGSDAA